MHDPDFLRLLMFGFVIDQARSFFIRHFRFCEGQDASVLMLADLSPRLASPNDRKLANCFFRLSPSCEGQDARRFSAGVSRSYSGYDALGGRALVRSLKV